MKTAIKCAALVAIPVAILAWMGNQVREYAHVTDQDRAKCAEVCAENGGAESIRGDVAYDRDAIACSNGAFFESADTALCDPNGGVRTAYRTSSHYTITCHCKNGAMFSDIPMVR